MFKDVVFAEWSTLVTVVAFAASVGIFFFFLIGALRTPKDKIKHDAEMPLQEETRR
jgi:hypothetical protein